MRNLGLRVIMGWLLIGLSAAAQDAEPPTDGIEPPEDPFASSWAPGPSPPAISPGRAERKTATLLVRLDVYEVPTAMALELLDGWKAEEGAGGLREHVQAAVMKGEGEVVDVIAKTTDAGLKTTCEGIREYTYPTEYEPPALLPLPFDDKSDAELTPWQKLMRDVNTIASPTAFETRNMGSTLEVEVRSVAVEEGRWDVSFAVETVSLEETSEWRPSLTMPVFGSCRTSGSFRMDDGSWMLVACLSTTDEAGKPLGDVKRLYFLNVKQMH